MVFCIKTSANIDKKEVEREGECPSGITVTLCATVRLCSYGFPCRSLPPCLGISASLFSVGPHGLYYDSVCSWVGVLWQNRSFYLWYRFKGSDWLPGLGGPLTCGVHGTFKHGKLMVEGLAFLPRLSPPLQMCPSPANKRILTQAVGVCLLHFSSFCTGIRVQSRLYKWDVLGRVWAVIDVLCLPSCLLPLWKQLHLVPGFMDLRKNCWHALHISPACRLVFRNLSCFWEGHQCAVFCSDTAAMLYTVFQSTWVLCSPSGACSPWGGITDNPCMWVRCSCALHQSPDPSPLAQPWGSQNPD